VTASLPAPPAPDQDTAGDRRRPNVARFDDAARDYDRVGESLALGSGSWYRRFALRRAGLRPGMTLLDVAAGTGLIAREAVGILGDPGAAIGIDASAAMLREGRRTLASPLVQGWAEALPFRSGRFDMLSLGFALRHVPDLDPPLRECLRVLKPGGRLLVLELTRPQSRTARWLIRLHVEQALPWIVGLRTRNEAARQLASECWGTIDRGVPPETVLDHLRRIGFVDVRHRVWFGLFGEYLATKPGAPSPHPGRDGAAGSS
jgi:demethylmenaquinone methyltransferase/2-methoxy-6-polyprenyl-1,4-benzoquinol methylase